MWRHERRFQAVCAINKMQSMEFIPFVEPYQSASCSLCAVSSCAEVFSTVELTRVPITAFGDYWVFPLNVTCTSGFYPTFSVDMISFHSCDQVSTFLEIDQATKSDVESLGIGDVASVTVEASCTPPEFVKYVGVYVFSNS